MCSTRSSRAIRLLNALEKSIEREHLDTATMLLEQVRDDVGVVAHIMDNDKGETIGARYRSLKREFDNLNRIATLRMVVRHL